MLDVRSVFLAVSISKAQRGHKVWLFRRMACQALYLCSNTDPVGEPSGGVDSAMAGGDGVSPLKGTSAAQRKHLFASRLELDNLDHARLECMCTRQAAISQATQTWNL